MRIGKYTNENYGNENVWIHSGSHIAILRNFYLLLLIHPFLKNYKCQIPTVRWVSSTRRVSSSWILASENYRNVIVGQQITREAGNSKTQGRLSNYLGDQQVQRELEKFWINSLKKNSYFFSLLKTFINEFSFPHRQHRVLNIVQNIQNALNDEKMIGCQKIWMPVQKFPYFTTI